MLRPRKYFYRWGAWLVVLGCAGLPLSVISTEPATPPAPKTASTAAVAPPPPSFDATIVKATKRFDRAEAFEALSGGAGTSHKLVDSNAFSHPSANLPLVKLLDFEVGNGLFRRFWASAPASTRATDGLGPLFNARACQNCHIKDGRGHVPRANWPQDDAVSFPFKLSIPRPGLSKKALAEASADAFQADPIYGMQLQDAAVPGHKPEAKVDIEYTEQQVKLGEEIVQLRTPHYRLVHLAYGPPHPDMRLSARVSPPMIGLGLLAALSEESILANADPDDSDGDGISGRANWVWSSSQRALSLGRFGWKAAQATLADQIAMAFKRDMGLSTPLQMEPWGDCTPAQKDCRNAPHGNAEQADEPELDQNILDLVEFYTANLAVPVRRDVDNKQVLQGKEAFYRIGCQGCHVPKFITPTDVPPSLQAQADQLIWPYSDLLLHDMGEGLADQLPEGKAIGREWRTPPLWGIGLTRQVSPLATFLHDGRARTLTEAILWHGGEAETSAMDFRALPASERVALLAFLNSL